MYVTWLFLVEPMRIQTTIGSAKKLAALQRINLGKGPKVSLTARVTRERIKKIAQESGVRICVYVTWLFLVEPMRIETTIASSTSIGSAKKLASFAEEKFGEGALSISDSKSEKKKKKKKKKNTFGHNCIPTTKMPDWQIIGAFLIFFAVQTHRIWYYYY